MYTYSRWFFMDTLDIRIFTISQLFQEVKSEEAYYVKGKNGNMSYFIFQKENFCLNKQFMYYGSALV